MTNDANVAFINANVRTVDSHDSVAQALLIKGGKIAAVGTDEAIRGAADPGTEMIDLAGGTIVPGFIDAHNHLSIAAFAPDSVDCSTPPRETLADVFEAIHDHCANLPRGQWVMGMGFSALHIREGRNPTRYELDEVAPNNPFLLIDASCHAGWANSAALAAVGITSHTPQPWGGEITKDHSGEPTGELLEAAINLAQAAAWNGYAERDWDHAVDLLESKMREYLAVGLTGIGDAMVTARSHELYRRADASGRLPLTVQQLHGGDYFFAQQELRRGDIVDRIKGSESSMLRSGSVKIFADRAYPDGPAIDHLHDGCTTHAGSSFYSKGEIHELAIRATELGIDPVIHAMGNCAIDHVLDAYEDVRRRAGSDGLLRMEHAFVADPAQGARIANLGVDLVMNPGLVFGWGELFSAWRGGQEESLRVLPVRSMIDAGVRVSLASDHPCGTFSPAEIMWTAIARTTASGVPVDTDEAITATEALRAYTINAAAASGRSGEEGSIEVGKRGNVLVLDRDILTCSTGEVKDICVQKTFVDGKLAYSTENVSSL